MPNFKCKHCSRVVNTAQGLKSHITRLHKDSSDEENISIIDASPTDQSPSSTGISFASLLANLKCSVNILRRIPKGARTAAAEALASTIDACLLSNSVVSWERLLLFSVGCFRLPKKSARKVSLATTTKNNISLFMQGATFRPFSPRKSPIACNPPEPPAIARRVETKISDGDIKGALRILSSEDSFAPFGPETMSALQAKHPSPTRDLPPVDPNAHIDAHPCLRSSESSIRGAIQSFPHGSAGGPDMLRPQHLKDLVGAGDAGSRLLVSISGLCNIMLSGEVPEDVRPLLYGATLCALKKKYGGIRPIAVGNTWRRLSAKIGCNHIRDKLSKQLQPIQLGFGTPGGAEAAIHAARHFITSTHNGPMAFLKIDFLNAFNLVDRQSVLQRAATSFPELFPFIAQCYSRATNLFFGEETISSARGVQQGDPLGPAIFCAVIHPMATAMTSDLNIWYLDDGALGGNPESVLHDFRTIIQSSSDLGLEVNISKCELFIIGGSAEERAGIISSFEDLAPTIRTPNLPSCSLLGAPLVPEAIPASLDIQSRALKIVSDRLSYLKAHIAFYLLRNCLAIPKLTYLLRCTPTWREKERLIDLDSILRGCLENICNTRLNENAWMQSTLPIALGGMGVKCASTLAIPAFLASYHSNIALIRAILPAHLSVTPDTSTEEGLQLWQSGLSPEITPLPPPERRSFQKAWETPGIGFLVAKLHEQAASPINKARLLSVSTTESGAFLHALPSAPLGTLLCDQVFRIAVSLRLGSPICQEHTCVCGSAVDTSGIHGLSCIKGSGRRSRHAEINDLLRRGLMSAGIPAILEPANLSPTSNSRPDGMTMTPWTGGKSLVWDFTCSNSLAASHVNSSALEPLYAAKAAESNKIRKYEHLSGSYIFAPVAVECLGSFGPESLKLVKDLGKRISAATGEPRAQEYLLQRISVAVQRGNAACVMGTIPSSSSLEDYFCFL